MPCRFLEMSVFLGDCFILRHPVQVSIVRMEESNCSGELAIHCGHSDAHDEYVMRKDLFMKPSAMILTRRN